MSKIKIKVCTKEDNTMYDAIYREDKAVIYKENNNITMKYDFNSNTLIRMTNEFIGKFNFNDSICLINVLNINKSIEIPIKIHKKHISNNIIEIEYEIEEETIYYRLEILK